VTASARAARVPPLARLFGALPARGAGAIGLLVSQGFATAPRRTASIAAAVLVPDGTAGLSDAATPPGGGHRAPCRPGRRRPADLGRRRDRAAAHHDRTGRQRRPGRPARRPDDPAGARPGALASAVLLTGPAPSAPGARTVSVQTWAAEQHAPDDRVAWTLVLLLMGVSAG
jgi:hypothetical protein